MQRTTTLWLFVLVVVVLGSGLFLLSHNSADGTCKHTGNSYTATIRNDMVTANDDIHGHLCDTLTVVNKDKETREIAFGAHEDHVPYDGVAEKFLNQNQSFTVTFNKTGSYHWHDHEHDEVQGFFTVTK